MQDSSGIITHFLQPGTLLGGGKYTIEQKIGEGGFGITYRAVQSALNRIVCIKEYFPAGRSTRITAHNTVMPQGIDEVTYEKYRQAFRKEAETLASLQHPSIVEVIDIFDENNTSYMVMPFIEGRSLQQIVKEQGPLDYPQAVNYLAQVADAVAYIHEHHILHRDIKPDNILVTADYRAILIDFGSAREFINDKTQSHTSILTHGYAPTEQYSTNSRKGSYTDIYALGATFYFILTGSVPLDAAARMTEEMMEPKALNPAIPDEANRTILKAMQMRAPDRHQSVQEFMDDLRNVHPSQPIANTSQQPQAVSLPPEKKGNNLGLKIALGVVAGIVLTAILLIFGIRSNTKKYHETYAQIDTSATVAVETEVAPQENKEPSENVLNEYIGKYSKYIFDHSQYDEFRGWQLIYLDNDSIPEMYLTTGYSAGGCLLLSYKNGKVHESNLSLSFQYIPFKSRVLNETGNMGYYFSIVEELRNGTLHEIANIHCEHDEQDFDNENLVKWYINDNLVSKETAEQRIKQEFNSYGKPVSAGEYAKDLRAMDVLYGY